MSTAADLTTDAIIKLTSDVVLFAPDEHNHNHMHVLLIQRGHDPFQGRWALPGGHVGEGEEAPDAAERELLEETGLRIDTLPLTEVAAYSEVGRDPRGRYVTVAYTATLPALVEPTAGDDAKQARWWPIEDLRADMLAFDHLRIIQDAVVAYREELAESGTSSDVVAAPIPPATWQMPCAAQCGRPIVMGEEHYTLLRPTQRVLLDGTEETVGDNYMLAETHLDCWPVGEAVIHATPGMPREASVRPAVAS